MREELISSASMTTPPAPAALPTTRNMTLSRPYATWHGDEVVCRLHCSWPRKKKTWPQGELNAREARERPCIGRLMDLHAGVRARGFACQHAKLIWPEY
jgi:hypothetical protein